MPRLVCSTRYLIALFTCHVCGHSCYSWRRHRWLPHLVSTFLALAVTCARCCVTPTNATLAEIPPAIPPRRPHGDFPPDWLSMLRGHGHMAVRHSVLESSQAVPARGRCPPLLVGLLPVLSRSPWRRMISWTRCGARTSSQAPASTPGSRFPVSQASPSLWGSWCCAGDAKSLAVGVLASTPLRVPQEVSAKM